MLRNTSRSLPLSSALLLLPLLLQLLHVQAATFQQVSNFGSNPGGLNFWLYLPTSRAAHPPIAVVLHSCGGNAAYAKSVAGDMVALADQKGFVMVFPEVTRSSKCFDVSSTQSLSHNGGSDGTSVVQMVQYVLNNYNGDADRVYAWGFSSGAMMTNVLMGSYPDVFAAGTAVMGVPFYCFYTGSIAGWNGACSGGVTTHSPAEWAQYVHNAFPSYTGAYPRMQLLHGTTDDTLSYHNFGEEIKQWTAVHSLSQTPAYTDSPRSGWTRTRYGGTDAHALVEGLSVSGVGHDLPLTVGGNWVNLINVFFGLDQGGVPRNNPTTPTTCAAPANPANGHFTCSGVTCTLICDSGYGASGAGFTSCVNNVWSTLPACVSSGAGSVACGLVSENNVMSLSCAAGQVINAVEFASYGAPQGSCTSSAISACHAASSLSAVSAACVSKSSCSVTAANSVFGDPCPGTAKQLAVRAHCAAASAVCASGSEYSTLTVSCPAGKSIYGISFASYGTPSGSCSAGFTASSSCHAQSSLDVVQKTCVGKSSCAFTGGQMNAVFGDPCSGTGKTLAVQALCV